MEAYNYVLSDRRALAAVTYLVFKGIDEKRLTWKGYGELLKYFKLPKPKIIHYNV